MQGLFKLQCAAIGIYARPLFHFHSATLLCKTWQWLFSMAATNKRTQTNIERKHLSATTRSYAVIMFTVWPLSSLPIMQNIVTCKGPPSMQRQRWKSFVLMLHQIFQDLNCLIWLELSHFRLVLQCLWHSPSHKAGDAIFIALYCHRSNKVSCCALKPFFWSQFFYLLQERGI